MRGWILNKHFPGKVVRKDLTKLVKDGNTPLFFLASTVKSGGSSVLTGPVPLPSLPWQGAHDDRNSALPGSSCSAVVWAPRTDNHRGNGYCRHPHLHHGPPLRIPLWRALP